MIFNKEFLFLQHLMILIITKIYAQEQIHNNLTHDFEFELEWEQRYFFEDELFFWPEESFSISRYIAQIRYGME